MADNSADTVLRRLVRGHGGATAGDGRAPGADAPEGPVTPARALRLALTRAAEGAVGLSLTVLGVTEEMLDLDEMLARLDPEAMLLAVNGPEGAAGLVALDPQIRAALVEVQTIGKLRTTATAARPVSASDVALSQPLVGAMLRELCVTAEGSSLAGWADAMGAGHRLADARAAGMVLASGRYRLVRMTIDLCAGDRQGALLLALPPAGATGPVDAVETGKARWEMRFQSRVLDAPADLHAVLHRMRLPFRAVEGLAVGQVLPLPGVTVSSVRIEGPGAQSLSPVLGRARLGQIAGLRAIRLERAPPPELGEVRHQPRPELPRDTGQHAAGNTGDGAGNVARKAARIGDGIGAGAEATLRPGLPRPGAARASVTAPQDG